MFHRRYLILFHMLMSLIVINSTTTESNNHNSGRLFRENLQRLQTFGMCGIPRPRVFYVEDHPEADATLTYHPSATVVHRCDPSGGCCRDRRKQCSPLEESVVDIFFFVHLAVHHQSNSNNNRTLFTSLPFVNHTQCICTDINDVPRR
uniref:Platelet-derived growth factor (PDGF) family profile domain-containing protein n=1 Tax=Daphnia galeata TaxID=27404 RepID=A0A8J2WHJ9_9CRUS|nr:unnamed protein product [Daphnia galeata]